MSNFYRRCMCRRPPTVVYGVVNDVQAYPEYLPFCYETSILESTSDHLTAKLSFKWGLKTLCFTTRNSLSPYDRIGIQLVEGPFHHLEGAWKFKSVGRETEVICELDYQFSNSRFQALFNFVLPVLLNRLVRCFVDRAHQISSDDSSLEPH